MYKLKYLFKLKLEGNVCVDMVRNVEAELVFVKQDVYTTVDVNRYK